MKGVCEILGIIACCFLLSCRQDALRGEMEQFLGSKVVLPADEGAEHRKAQLVIWFDSLDCHTCRLKIFNVIDQTLAMQYSKETNGAFGIRLILSPKRRDGVAMQQTVDAYDLKIPVWVDQQGEFWKTNPHLPHDLRLRSFLLDENGTVVLVGDPLFNTPLWELYKKTIVHIVRNEETGVE